LSTSERARSEHAGREGGALSLDWAPSDGITPPHAWHALQTDRVVALLAADVEHGLTSAEVRRRLRLVGPNRAAEVRERPLWRLALDQFRSLVVLLLLTAAALAAALGERRESLAILAALLLNAAIGFGTEWRARRSLARLRGLLTPRALARRTGRIVEVAAAELVPGDIIVLQAGSQVPADARLLQSAGLQLDEAALTGESQPVDKDASVPAPAGAPVAERSTMVYLGTAVLAGSGAAAVTATGLATELGRIGQLVALLGERTTPLERQVEGLGRRLIVLALAICALVAVVGVLHGQPPGLMLETAISLAVAAIPEGLPAIVAVALAAGLWRLARAGALVRRMPAVEALGSTTVICSDKTGTMTENRMVLSRLALNGGVIQVGGGPTAPRGDFRDGERVIDPRTRADLIQLLTVAALVNDASVERRNGELHLHGDPTEAALVVAAVKAGLDPDRLAGDWPRHREIPFSSTSRFMATFHAAPDGAHVALVKGAPGVVLERSRYCQRGAERVELTDGDRAELLNTNRVLAAEGLRILAVAWRPDGDDQLHELTFLGLVALEDPIRPSVEEAIARCGQAGIRTIMLTGDQHATAEAVGRRLGLDADAIRSRVSPEAKLKLIESLQAQGEVVAMTGDGINDAPALVRADIGVAMGRHGTDVARDAADIVLTDDNFATIVAAVAEGRVIYANLSKVIHFLFTCNLTEIAAIFVAVLLGLPAPLLPLQILWVNLVTDILPAVALIRDPAEPDIMRRPPRNPRLPLITWRLGTRILAEGTLLSAGVLSAYTWALLQEGVTPRANTMAFVALVLMHPLQAAYCRSDLRGWWRLPRNSLMWVAALTLVLVQWGAISWAPLATVLSSVPLSAVDWIVTVAAVTWPVAVLEGLKAWRNRRRRSRAS
jgi:P-type Ca2+ transporter type 2C